SSFSPLTASHLHTLPLHDALPIWPFKHFVIPRPTNFRLPPSIEKPQMHELYAALADNKSRNHLIHVDMLRAIKAGRSPILLTERDRKSTRLNSSHDQISYAVFCLK